MLFLIRTDPYLMWSGQNEAVVDFAYGLTEVLQNEDIGVSIGACFNRPRPQDVGQTNILCKAAYLK
jgi:hypothetical protein